MDRECRPQRKQSQRADKEHPLRRPAQAHAWRPWLPRCPVGRPQHVVASFPLERTRYGQGHQAAEELGRRRETACELPTVVAAAHVVVDGSALLRGQRSNTGRHQRRKALAPIAAPRHQQVANRVAQSLLGPVDQDCRVTHLYAEDLGNFACGQLAAEAKVEHRILPRLQARGCGPDELG